MGKKVYLLGAGFATLFNAPTTSDLTDSLSSMNLLNYKIHTILRRQLTPNDITFEAILSALEYLISYRSQFRKNAHQYSVAPVLSKLRCSLRREDAEQSYIDSINHIINRIAKYELKRDETKDRLVRQHFTDAESNHIYSLNYDRIIPRVFDKNGIEYSDGTINRSAFKQSIKEFILSPNSFFNLHGNIYLYQSTISFNDVYQADAPRNIRALIPINGGNPKEKTCFAPIISGFSKTQRMMSTPTSFGISTFAVDLQECSELEIIGYSFSDPHINNLIGSFFDFQKKKLTIVECFKSSDCLTKLEDLQCILSSYYHKLPDGPEEKNGLFLYDNRLSIYTKGVEEYLKMF